MAFPVTILCGALVKTGSIGYAIALLLGVAAIPIMAWLGLAASVKRWHDRGKSGRMVLITLMPLDCTASRSARRQACGLLVIELKSALWAHAAHLVIVWVNFF